MLMKENVIFQEVKGLLKDWVESRLWKYSVLLSETFVWVLLNIHQNKYYYLTNIYVWR